MQRRNFIQAASGAVAMPYYVPARAFGANDRVNVGIIGIGGRASWLVKNEEWAGAQIVAVADCWKQRLDEASKLRPDAEKWAKYTDYR